LSLSQRIRLHSLVIICVSIKVKFCIWLALHLFIPSRWIFTISMRLWYLKIEEFNMFNYSDDDHIGCRVDMKEHSRTYQFLENYLVSRSFKKQNSIVFSTAEAEYITVGAYYAEVLWMKHTLLDCDMHYDHIKIYCDNTSTIHMTKIANRYSKTKHIKIRYHFLRNHYKKGNIEIE